MSYKAVAMKLLLGYDKIDWFVEELRKLKKDSFLFFLKKDIIMTEKDEEQYWIVNICRFCDKEFCSKEFRDQCQLTGKNRDPAHQNCNFTVTQKKSNFIPFLFNSFSIYDCHLFFRNLVDKRDDESKFDITLETNEKCLSATYGCFRFIDTYPLLSSSFDL